MLWVIVFKRKIFNHAFIKRVVTSNRPNHAVGTDENREIIAGWTAPPLTPHPNDTQYCPLLAPPNQTSQEVTHPGTTLVEARLIAEF